MITCLSNIITYPARKPATNAPKKPAPIALASIPPIIPGTIPGLSAIENAINPASTGSINANDVPPPICINAAANVPC